MSVAEGGQAAGIDLARVRADFPILRREVNGRPLIYLDSAASAQRPQAVIDAELDCYRRYYANVHRGVHTLSQESTAAFEGAREQVRRFLNAASEREVVFVRGATEAINLVAHSFAAPRLQPGDEVLVTHMEHHSNIVPWQLACERTGAQLRVVPVTDDGEIELDAVAARINERTRLISVVHVSNTLGTVNPVAEIAALARERGVPILVDGAQAAPHLPVDVQALGVDFYAFSGHKAYGPSGIGALYGRYEHLAAMAPYQGGGDMIRRVAFEGTEYAEPPARFEAGTPNIAGAIGLGEALRYLEGLGRERLAAHERALVGYAAEALAAVPGVELIGTPQRRAGAVSFVMAGTHPNDVAMLLDEQGIAVRAGHHCTQPLMERFGVSATARASFGCYNGTDEVDALIEALHRIRRLFGA
ncbi:aminotransferase class V-fold PLP-dependent enzyme [Halorhodospira neutriphila]|uniref:Cysteine desulfurase n=1 Tax=Halorhodospira neutriphila TaxID=168379 RepID=A0ABS1E5T0_9GAMM|nr:cysteine desulfurase [Halorhodospira neutriphila]MBK1726878.1 cysteine desulfurase CsdA [Halorhodospira neutriphila]